MYYQNKSDHTINNKQKNNNEKSVGEHQGGFVSELHSVQKELYGPDSPMPEKWKIFFCIKHKILRNWEKTLSRKGGIISHEKIMRETGITDKSNFNRHIKHLVKEKMILADKHDKGVFYQLHPERFGSDYIYEPGRKKMHLSVVEEHPDILDEEEESQNDSEPSNIDHDVKDSSHDYQEPSQGNHVSGQNYHPPIQRSATTAASQGQKFHQEPFQEPIQEGNIIDLRTKMNPKEIMKDWFSRNNVRKKE